MNTKQIVYNFLKESGKIVYRLGHKRSIPVRVTEFICASEIVPSHWSPWFWEAISQNAPFSWGDNNRTFVTASRFADHCEHAIDIQQGEYPTAGAKREWLKKIRGLGQIYIDLEN